MKIKSLSRGVCKVCNGLELRKSARLKVCLLAAVPVAAGLLPRVVDAQTGNLIFQVTANDFNPTTGVLTSDVGPAGTLIGAGSVTIQNNATPNNQPALDFNGTGGFSLNSALAETSNQVTIFAVVLPNINAIGSSAATIISGGPGSFQYRIDGAGVNNGEPAYLDRDQFQFANSAYPISSNLFSVIDASNDPINAAPPNGCILNTNGITVGDNGGYGQNIGNITAFGAGDNNDDSGGSTSLNEFFTGDIAEVQVYDGVLSTAQRQSIETTLEAQFGIITTFNWNVASGSFTTPANWDNGKQAPGDLYSLQTVNIDNGGTATISSGTIGLGNLYVGNAATGTIVHTGGALTVLQNMVIANSSTATGTYNMTGGSVTTANLYVGINGGTGYFLQGPGSTVNITNNFEVGETTGTGTYNMTGGTLNYSGGNYLRVLGSPTPSSINLSGNAVLNATGQIPLIAVDNNGTGILSITGNATVNSPPGFGLGYAGCTGALNISGNGTFNTGGSMLIGWFGYGVINLTSGTLNETGGSMLFGYGGTSTLNQSGGTVNVNTGGWDVQLGAYASGNTFNITGGTFNDLAGGTLVGFQGTAVFNLGGGTGTAVYNVAQTQVFGGSTLNLNANSTFFTNSLQGAPGNGGTINFSGGTLRAMSSSSNFLLGSTGLSVNTLGAGAFIDTNGFNGTVSASIAGPGSVTKTGGGGTLVMAGSNTYTGATKINAGTLQLLGPNPNFALPSGAGGANYAPFGGGWTFPVSPQGSGITDGSAFNFNGTPPSGYQAAFLQQTGIIFQTFYFPTAGTYSLSFYTEQRPGQAEDFDVTLDGANPGTLPSDLYAPGSWTQETYTFSTTAGSHTLQFTGLDNSGGDNTAFLDDITFSAPNVVPLSNGVPSTSAVTIAAGATFDLNSSAVTIGSLSSTASTSAVTLEAGALITGGDGTNTNFAGSISDGGQGGSVVKIGAGVQTLSGSNTYTGATQVSGGTLIFTGANSLPNSNTVIVGPGSLLVLPSQTAASSVASMNVSGNVIIHGGSISLLTTAVGAGYAGGTWAGTTTGAINSGMAAADSSHLTAVGVILNTMNGSAGATALYSSFEGQPASNTDVLVKYTYYGDTDLNGKVDGTDYSRIDNAYSHNLTFGPGAQLTGWFNGDFNYDGVVNGSDYTLIDNTFNMQGAQISAQLATATAQISSTSAVPEPATLSLLAIGAAGILARRRRRSN